MPLDPAFVESVRCELLATPHGERNELIARYARLSGVAPVTLRRQLETPTGKRERKGSPMKQEYRTWAETIYQVKKRPPQDAGELSLEDAVAIAVQQGLVPVEAAQVNLATYSRIARQEQWNKTEKRRNRIQAERPNQTHHFDASSSKFFYIARKLGDGDYVMRIHRPGSGDYKNKPVPVDRLRPWYYGIADDHSGRFLTRCSAERGESSVGAMEFLFWAWSQMGICDELAADEGMIKKAFASRDWLHRLGVALPDSMPYEKEAHGKIERPWRTLWKKFETTFYAISEDWRKFEITVSEYNRQLAIFLADKYNALPHRFERGITKMQAWERINLHGGIVTIPENALATVVKRDRRKIGVDGTISYNGQDFEVLGLHDAWVYVWEGVFGDKIVVQDCETGKKYDVRPFTPLVRGEYRAHPATPHEKLITASQTLPLTGQGLYGEKKTESEKIIRLPLRTAAERRLHNPLDITAYPSLHAAMAELTGIIGASLTDSERRDIETYITEHGLKKQIVTDLALDIRASLEQQRAAGGL